MPEKSSIQREKQAKRHGIPLMTRKVEAGASSHAMKKSRHNLREVEPAGRHVKRKAAPGAGSRTKTVGLSGRGAGAGKARRDQEKPLDFVDAVQARQMRVSELLDAQPAPRRSTRRPATVRGRKKAPSEMGVRKKGGPRKRTRLHGG